MSRPKDVVRKVAPDLFNLGVDLVRHHLNNKDIDFSAIEDEEPMFDLEGDISRLDRDPLIDIVGEMEESSGLDLGYEESRSRAERVEEQPSHVGREASRPPQTVKKQEYGAEAKSFKEQSDVDYCIECAVKHGSGAKVLMREALQRAEAADPASPGVIEKVRAVTEELTGVEHDTDTVNDPGVMALNTMARTIRKQIYTSGAEIGRASKEELQGIKVLVDELVDASYLAREAEEGDCPSCRHSVGISMGLNVGKSLDMPDIDELETLVKDEQVDPVAAMDAIIGHAKNVDDKDAVDYLTGVKKMMTTPL